uniref:D-xylose 1-dehydrogenase (NADP(+), D-xylono-1,5-lactone-forming) n=1 Tax=Blastobotrys adeninivorans TaxID=409370 RepID=A0A060TBT2_BLAAD
MVYTCKWGIMATGGIARQFCDDLIKDPKDRNATDIAHEIVAVASSSSKDKADKFVKDNKYPGNIATYGDYQSLVNDANVDVVYVASPHGLHYEHAKLALTAGKNVLCEKAFTINEAQAKELVRLAREKNVFLMEALWTRYFPLVKELKTLLFEKRILGKLIRIVSDNAIKFDVDNLDLSHRMLDPKLGGGALLDLGIYSLTWPFVFGYGDPDNKKQAPSVAAQIVKNSRTGVDETTSMLLTFPGSGVSAIATTSMVVETLPQDTCRIEGEKGTVTIVGPSFRPEAFVVTYNDNRDKPEKHSFDMPGRGMFYEADEVARCLRDGRKESESMTLDETILIMGTMDAVRRQNNFEYPKEVEAV